METDGKKLEKKVALSELKFFEVVENIIAGFYNNGHGLLIATQKRLIFVDKGLFSLKVEDFPYEKITSVQYESGIMSGKITILASGNKAIIDNTNKTTGKEFSESVRLKISSNNITKNNNVVQDDVYSKLEKIAKLKDQGILTQEEFEFQKAKLLSE